MIDQMAQNPPSHAEKSPHLTVLVVDDERLIRWSLSQALADRGHEVTTASTGAEALREIADADRHFDVVLLDYRLPDRQDLTLLEDVRRQLPQSVVLMMTAFGDDNMRTGAREHGAFAVIDKPFQLKSLVSLIESAAAR
jgi:DNA-binding NtrC family response regulator